MGLLRKGITNFAITCIQTFQNDSTIVVLFCFMNSDCKLTRKGLEYIGNVNKTKMGTTCQRWDSQTPHKHTFYQPDNFPDSSLDEVANSCRNPDNYYGGPWCYTTDPEKRWEFCDVPFCGK